MRAEATEKAQWRGGELFPQSHDRARREMKYAKIIQVLAEFMGRETLAGARCLDIGCASGYGSELLASRCAEVVGVDIELASIERASQGATPGRTRYLVNQGATLPFAEESFDLVVYNYVAFYEPGYARQIDEVRRILKKGGVCYFSTINRFPLPGALTGKRIHEIPCAMFWLPGSVGRWYARRRETIELYPSSYWLLKRILAGFEVHDYTGKILVDPEKYLEGDNDMLRAVDRIPRGLRSALARFFIPFVDAWIMVLVKV